MAVGFLWMFSVKPLTHGGGSPSYSQTPCDERTGDTVMLVACGLSAGVMSAVAPQIGSVREGRAGVLCHGWEDGQQLDKTAPKSWERLRCGEALLDSGGLTERGLDECYGALPNHKHGGVAATDRGMRGMIDASTTDSPWTPFTLQYWSTTAIGLYRTHLARPGDVSGGSDSLPDIEVQSVVVG